MNTDKSSKLPLAGAALAAVAAFASLCAVIYLAPPPISRVTRVAFGSCSQPWALHQPVWRQVLALRPDVWAWVGDAVYADTTDIARTRALYRTQLSRPDYQAVLRHIPVIGTWDDHDYGVNDGGKEYPAKAASQQAFLDFIGEPLDSPRRTREGIYTSHRYGGKDERLKIILLDTRYHRDRPGPRADLLGEAQWRWLEAEFAAADADLILLVSSILVIPRAHAGESWGRFPASGVRLGRLIKTSAAPVVILSGDIHLGELSRWESPGLRWPVYELTSSGLTHSASQTSGYKNPFRVGELFVWQNFGLVSVDWGTERIAVTLEIRDVENRVQIADTVSFHRSSPRESGGPAVKFGFPPARE